jgi:hypothetical protein
MKKVELILLLLICFALLMLLPLNPAIAADSCFNGSFQNSVSVNGPIKQPSTQPLNTPKPLSSQGDNGPPDDASDWAKAGMDEAISLDIIPHELQNNYRFNITREEFCQLVVQMIVAKSGAVNDLELSTVELLLYSEMDLSDEPFSDTSDRAVKLAYDLHIVNGTGNGLFSPKSFITRQEAAVMLGRTAAVWEVTAYSNSPIQFTDAGDIAPWAKASIDFVSANGIMEGTGNGNFSPQANYTREQAILTVLRLYKAFPGELDSFQVELQVVQKLGSAATDEDMNSLADVIRRRLDVAGIVEPVIRREGQDRLIIEWTGFEKLEIIAALFKTAKLEFRDPDGNVILTGDDLIDAKAQIDNSSLYFMNRNTVAFTFSSHGAEIFKTATETFFGQEIGIYIDNQLLSSPMVNAVIPNGEAVISGGFATFEEAAQLAALLRSGALPLAIEVIAIRNI